MACSYSYLQANFYKRFDGAVSITVVLKESDNTVEGSSPIKNFFLFFYLFAFAKMQVIFRDLHVCRKKHVLMYYAHAKPLHSVKWRSLYRDTATMQELLLKICTRLQARRKRITEPRHEISNNVVCATSKGSDQPAHTRSLIRAFASRLNIL